MIGRTLGHYEIIEPLGAGGMGEVYRAHDTTLRRDVAIKVLPEDLSADVERLARLQREAPLLAALNHPNIAAIHSLEEDDGVQFLVLELIEGRTLRELLNAVPLATQKMLRLATQIAGGLAKAHSAEIVHRDLKPENLMVTNDGFVKILDFGIAKLRRRPEETSESATAIELATRPGAVFGTVGYMSPEQASGGLVDYRSDQFSLGLILYEMATGKRAFQRDTAAETLTAIIREVPEPLGLLNANLPFHFCWIVEHCLAKDPEERYDSTRDLARGLQSVLEGLLRAGESASAVTEISGELDRQHNEYSEELALGKKLAKTIAYSNLSIKNDIIHATFYRTDKIVVALDEITKKIRWESDEVFFVNQSGGEITIVCEGDKEPLFRNIFPQAAAIRRKSAVIAIREPKAEGFMEGIEVPGLYAYFMNQVSRIGINLLDIVSTSSQLNLIISEEDLTRTYSALNNCIKQLRDKDESGDQRSTTDPSTGSRS